VKNVINNQLSACLIAKRINQSQLARRFDLSRAHVSRLVRGDVQPSLSLALKLARYFGKPVEHVFSLDGGNQPAISPTSLGSAGEQTRNNTETMKG
jgi:putative transcriptional regulator